MNPPSFSSSIESDAGSPVNQTVDDVIDELLGPSTVG
jgi:hypothetical protein